MMIDREKVIKGLECCATNRLRREDCEAMDCVYLELEGHGCIHQLIRDALALQKAQEPNEDWISRKRLKDEIQYYIDEAGWGDEANKVLGWCMEFIDNQMAVKWE